MANVENDRSTTADLALPLPPESKRRQTTSFSKCIICQSDSSSILRKAKVSSISNLIAKLKIRQGDVYTRLLPHFEKLYEIEVVWHSTCYASYTSLENLKYSTSQTIISPKEDCELSETQSIPHGRVSRSTCVPTDWTKCLFCKNATHKKVKDMQNVSTFGICKTIMDAAEIKGDTELIHILLGVNNDLVAAEAKYHKACLASYISKQNLKSQSFKAEKERESVYDQAFREMAFEINQGLQVGIAYDMTSLLAKYVNILNAKGVDGQSYTKHKLKLRLKKHFAERIVFHQPYGKINPELVYSSTISLQSVINAAVQHSEQIIESIIKPEESRDNDLSHERIIYNKKVLEHLNKSWRAEETRRDK